MTLLALALSRANTDCNAGAAESALGEPVLPLAAA
jgi:hypothetical protein